MDSYFLIILIAQECYSVKSYSYDLEEHEKVDSQFTSILIFERPLDYQHLLHPSFLLSVLRGDVYGPVHGLLQPRIPRVLRETPTREQQDVKEEERCEFDNA